MSFAAGTRVKVRLSGHPFHGKTVTVVEDNPAFRFNDDAVMRVVFVRHPSVPEPIGMHVSHLMQA